MPFLHRGDVVARHHAALDLVNEFEALVARQRFDVEHHVAVLAVATRLFLVTAALDDALLDGFAIADGGLVRRDHHAVAVGEPLGGNPQVHFALPPSHDLVRLRVVHDADRGVLLEQPVQRLAELDVVLALLGGDRKRQHRRQRRDPGERRMRLLAGGERIAGVGVIELAQRDGVAGLCFVALLGILAEQLEHPGNASGFLLGGDEAGAVADPPVEHARDRHLAAVRGVKGFHHVGDRIACRP